MLLSIFWITAFVLVLIAFIFLLPSLREGQNKIMLIKLFCLLLFSVCSLYLVWGESRFLKEYYSEEGEKLRLQQEKVRPIFSELKKSQGRLRLTLLENPGDALTKALLLELMGIEALHREDQALALRFWEAALEILPKGQETKALRLRMMGLKKTLGEKS